MRWTNRWKKRLRAVTRREVVERELEEELALHLELETEKNLRAGMSPQEARRQATLAFGGVERHKEEVRDARKLGWLPGLSLDLRLGARMLLKHPLMTAVSVLSLAVGIPMGLAPMHVMDAFEAPLPVEEGDRVLGLRYWNAEALSATPATSYDFSLWGETLRGFESLGAARVAEHNLDAGAGVGAPVSAAEVTSSAFPMLRTEPLLGRALQPEDDAPGAPPVVVLGHDVWRSRFAGDPDVVGRAVRVGGVVHTVVGVMPEGFLFPIHQQLWLPLRERPAGEPGVGGPLYVFGRLADGVSPEEAQSELSVAARRLGAEYPEEYANLTAEAVPFSIAMLGLPRGGALSYPGTWLMPLFAVVVLLVACANVGLLIFARTAARSPELAVRAALGASRARIVGQLFVEVLVLALVSTGLGLLLGDLLSNRLLVRLSSPDAGGVPWWVDLGVRPVTVVQALLLAVLSAVTASVIPALRVTGRRIQEPLRRAGATGSGVRIGVLSSALIMIDMALAVAVVGFVVGLSGRMKVFTLPEAAGVPAAQFLAAEIAVSDPGRSSPAGAPEAAAGTARRAALQRDLVERLEAEPAVRGVAVADVLPRMDHPMQLVEVRGGTAGDRFGAHEVEVARVDPGFFAALGQRVISGRDFNDADLQGDRRTVIVNRKFADRTLGGRNPVGRQIRYVPFSGEEPGPWYEIVGLVPDLGTNLLEPQNGLGVYHAAAAGEISPVRLAIRLGADPTSFAPRLRELADEVDPALVLTRAQPLDEVVTEEWRLIAGFRLAWAVCAGILLVLAASGMYAIMAFSVSQRTREIGIRAALGAGRGQIAAAIGGRAAVQVALGALVGMPLAGLAYYEVQKYTASTEGIFLVAVAPGVAVMLLVGLVACAGPLLRALRIVPTEAMRTDA